MAIDGTTITPAQQALLSQFADDLFLTGDDVGDRHASDWSQDHACRPRVVFKPRNAREVSQILRTCAEARQPLVIQGGLTGLSGGATPRVGEWALSTERMNQILELDKDAKTMTVQAGVTLQSIQEAADRTELVFPLDLGARGSCVAGGLVSTNAGGNQVIQHGMARALVLGLEAVLANGTIVSNRNKLLKNNAGFDLKQLFIGTEGTLGVVTEITFRLFAKKPVQPTALGAVNSFRDVVSLLRHLERSLPVISAFEVMWEGYFHAALEATASREPFAERHPFYVLIETEGADNALTDRLFEDALAEAMDRGILPDAAIAQSGTETDRFWAIRDGASELIPAMKPVATFDVGLPIAAMESFVSDARTALTAALDQCTALVFGHIADGNLHLLVTTGDKADLETIYDVVYHVTTGFGGTITAEHGVGVSKKKWLEYCRSETEIELMRRLKRALDPGGILNPGRVID